MSRWSTARVKLVVFFVLPLAGAGCRDSGAGAVAGGSSGGFPGSMAAAGSGGTSAPTNGTPDATLPTSDLPGATCSGALPADGTAPPAPFLAGASLTIAATRSQPVAPPAISGGTLLVLPGDQIAVAADPDRDRIYVIDLVGLRVTASIPLLPGDEPGRVTVDAGGRVHVALRHGGALVTIDPAAGGVTDRRSICAAPRGLAHDPTTDLIHVACAGGELVSLPAAGGGAVRTLHLNRDLRDVVVDGDRLRVSCFRSTDILTVDGDGTVSGRTAPGNYRDVAARGGQLFSPAVAWRMVAVPGGGVAMVHQRGTDDEVQQGTTPGSYGNPNGGRGNPCHTVVHSAVTRVMPDGTIRSGPAIGGLPLPVDLAVSPDGASVAIVSAANAHTRSGGGTGTAAAVHMDNMENISRGRSCTTPRPCGAGRTCDPRVPSVSGEAVAVAFLSSGSVIVQSREPAVLHLPNGSVPLSMESRADTGHMLFHANAGAGLACASCHAEGIDDGRVWNFACAGKRRTQSLQTGIRGTEPFHWDGDQKDFPQLVRDVFTNRMSGPPLEPDQTEAVLSWIDNQPRQAKAPPAEAAAVDRGRVLFTSTKAACATCHAGPQLTNNKTADVGTGGAFQVPSLVGLANHPPYMHTGCATTLLDRFSAACGGGDQHGVTSTLSAGEIADLISYLGTL
jgi:mono/diheme cytochrome c family protein/DNA-binding beta-propeller fold protein YncE